MYKTREEWLEEAIKLLNTEVFSGDLSDDITEGLKAHQVGCSLFSGNKAGDTVFPYEGEDIVGVEEFFPPTIHIDERIKEPETIVACLAHECIHCFMNIRKHNKQFGYEAKKIGFESPYTKLCVGEDLAIKCKMIAEKLGEWPGTAIVPHKKEKKKKTFSGKIFCPNCGWEARITEKMFKSHGEGLPTCPCGTKMALDCEDIDIHDEDDE